MAKLFRLRKDIPAFQNGGMDVISTGNPHLFGYIRAFENQRIIVINNFSDNPQKVDGGKLEDYSATGEVVNRLTDEVVTISRDLTIDAYRAVWLEVP
jgi:glycosidase